MRHSSKIPPPAAFALLALFALFSGCAQPPRDNPTPPQSESEILSDYVQLTRGFQRAGEAYFSADMQWIIFQATTRPDEDYQMYLAQLKWDGNDKIVGLRAPIRITPEGSWNSCGYFSPDGRSIIFASTGEKPRERPTGAAPGPSTRPELLRPTDSTARSVGRPTTTSGYRWEMPAEADIYRADGWKGAVAALPPGAGTNLARHPLTRNEAHDAECAFSPDGKWIVYMSKSGGDSELYAMRNDGSRRLRLTVAPGYDGGPFFSPDGKHLVYRSDRKGDDKLQVFVSDLVFDNAGNITGLKNERQLTNDDAVNFGPYWHPDGKHIVWANSLHGHQNYELYLMRDDGTHRTRITFTDLGDVLPVFSPDGKWLMWTSRRGLEKTSQIWVARFKKPKGS